MKTRNVVITCLLVLFVAVACKKDDSATALRIKLTDAPASYEEVNIDLREVKINFESDTAGWITLQTKAGIYNLLELQDGVDTLIAESVVPSGRIKEIRLVLGKNNSVKEGGEIFPMNIPSGSESGLKIKVNKNLSSSIDSLTIDFDAALSVTNEAEEYKLRPVLKIVQ